VDDAGRRTLIFLAALAALLAVARGGAPRAVILGLFVLYVVAATVWIRGQYAESLSTGSPWVLPGWWFAALVAGGVALAVVRQFLPAVVVGYFLIGSLLVRWRERVADRAGWGFGLAVVAAVLGVMGFGAMGRGGAFVLAWYDVPRNDVPAGTWGELLDALPLAMVGIALLALLPPAVFLLSEEAIDRLWKPGASLFPRWRLIAAAGGFVFIAVAVGAGVATRSLLASAGVLALGLLAVAMASSTLADIAVVLAVLAFMGVTPHQATEPDALSPGRGDDVLVALGDSYMSGEGASVFYSGTDDGGQNGCRRSPTSWAAMAGQQHPYDGLVFLACSGARTRNVLTHPDPKHDPAAEPKDEKEPRRQQGEADTQLRMYTDRLAADDFTPGLVVLSIGGNDAGFSTIGLMCLAPGNCGEKDDLWLDGLDQVEASLDATYAEVHEKFTNTPVVVIPYPDPIYEDEDDPDAACSQVALTDPERRFINTFIASLNERVTRAAGRYGFHVLTDMEDALATSGLQLCHPRNDGRPGLNFIGLRSVNGIPEQRFNPANWSHNSLHPNERGHAAMLRTFQNWRAAKGDLPDRTERTTDGESAPADGAAENAVAPRPPCDLLDVTPAGCRQQGQAWALRQTGEWALRDGLLVLLATAGAWTASVALFARRRSRASTASPPA
jgi:hypothetical protein